MCCSEDSPWYCKKIPLAFFRIYFLLSNSSLDECKTKNRVMGFWALERLYVDGYKQIIGFGEELIIFEPQYIKAKKKIEKAQDKHLLIPYNFIDKSSLSLEAEENKYFLIRITSLSKNTMEMEYVDVSKEGRMAAIRKHWVRP